MEFEKFPKIPRFNRDIIITEKIDGTNGQIVIERFLRHTLETEGRGIMAGAVYYTVNDDDTETAIWAGSRNRWLHLANKVGDNHRFARWVYDNGKELIKGLGVGKHFGEWYGKGIGRNYGLDHNRFALFNVTRWNRDMYMQYKVFPWQRRYDESKGSQMARVKSQEPATFVAAPDCCETVPVLYAGPWTVPDTSIHAPGMQLAILQGIGSQAVPGFMKPEGIAIFHTHGHILFKATIDGDEGGKNW